MDGVVDGGRGRRLVPAQPNSPYPNGVDIRPRRRRPVLGAKVTVPGVPDDFVRRTRLLRRVGAGVELPLTLLTAPAGYGKTLLLADWARQAPRAHLAWVSLDRDDNDASRFWSAVLTALDGDTEATALPGRRDPDAGAEEPDYVRAVGDTLEARGDDVVLVLDNVEEITAHGPLNGLWRLLRNRPPRLRLVLAGRAAPPIHVARIRVEGDLTEIGADDLRFDETEARQLMRRTGISLSPEQIAVLVERTEGWPAGLRLGASSLLEGRHADDPTMLFTDLDGADRPTAEYLADEVLADLPSSTRTVLQTVSVCEEVPAPLATELSGRADAPSLMHRLAQETPFVSWTGKQYRVHALIRAHLRTELAHAHPDRPTRLHQRAAEWFRARRMLAPALWHGTSSGVSPWLAEFLRGHASELILAGEQDRVMDALGVVGDADVARDPQLALASALAHVASGRLGAADLDLAHAPAQSWSVREQRALVESQRSLAGGERAPGSTASRSVRGEPAHEGWMRSTRGWNALLGGDVDGARGEFVLAGELAARFDYELLRFQTLVGLAAVDALTADLRSMADKCRKAIGLAGRRGWATSPWLTAAHVMLAYRQLQLGHRSELGRCIRAAWRAAAGSPSPALELILQVLEATALADNGDVHIARLQLRGLRSRTASAEPVPLVVALAAMTEHEIALAGSGVAGARDVVTWARAPLSGTAELAVMQARTQLMVGQNVPAARHTLAPALDGAAPAILATTRVEAALTETALAIRSDERTAARSALEGALRRAERADLVRPFVQVEPGVRRFLVEQLGSFGDLDEFATRVVTAASSARPTAVRSSSLTERELTVLARLPSQRSLDEIAADLTVSPNTVKTQVRAIYMKLGVNSRRRAVSAARENGLI